MLVTKISRTYSRSINARNYGAPESWVKIEATYEAVIESGDDPAKVSTMLYEQCQKEVVEAIKNVTDKMKAANFALRDQMNGGGNPAPSAPAAPVATAPVSPMAPTPVVPSFPVAQQPRSL